jgi:YjjG family noncanonical pyrimidine nucleotidase
MRYQWIIFDADGTLFDYHLAELKAFKDAFNYFGVTIESEYLDTYHQYNQQVWKDFEQGKVTISRLKIKRFEQLVQKIGISINPGELSERYLYYLSRSTQLIDGTEDVLKKLTGNVGMILMTNGIKEVQRSRLGLSTIGDYFSDIIISDEVGVAKPDNKIFEIALQRMSVTDKKTILMVGDNLGSDIKGGLDFGIDTCWYNPNQRASDPLIPADYEIKVLRDILPIIGFG